MTINRYSVYTCMYVLGVCLGGIICLDNIDLIPPLPIDLCPAAYYGPACLLPCPSTCIYCRGLDDCYNCQDGKWGPVCQYDCADTCANKICKQDSSTCNDCPYGHHGDSVNCTLKCSDHCLECNKMTGQCKKCLIGKKGDYCDEDCIAGCDERGCDQNGICIQCKDGFSGGGCSDPCGEQCAACQPVVQIFCTKCKKGFWGLDMCYDECAEGCKDKSCRDSDGHCYLCKEEGCTGPFCDQVRPEFQNCKRDDDQCGPCVECEPGFYGGRCEYECAEYCGGPKHECDRVTGVCNSCDENVAHGTMCGEHACETDGNCDVDTTTVGSTNGPLGQGDKTDGMDKNFVIVVAVVLIVVVIVIPVVIFIIKWRREGDVIGTLTTEDDMELQ